MNTITMPHSMDHAKQVLQTAIMIKPNLKVQPGPVIICSEGGRREKKGGGSKLFITNSKEGSAV